MIHLALTRTDRGDDDEDGIEHVQARQEHETDQDETENTRDDTVDQHRGLKVRRFLAVFVDLRRIAAPEPND